MQAANKGKERKAAEQGNAHRTAARAARTKRQRERDEGHGKDKRQEYAVRKTVERIRKHSSGRACHDKHIKVSNKLWQRKHF